MSYLKLFKYLKEFKKYAFLAPISVIFEVIIEIILPLLMAKIIDVGIANSDLGYITKTGLLMVGAALVSMVFGAASARYASVGATGFAMNLRQKLFEKIQDFSFRNVDHFSTASLVTRLTTDITFVQNSFMLLIRVLVRAPVMMISATIMAISINAKLAVIFLIAIPVLGSMLAIIVLKAHPYFVKMFKKYDAMNASIQENLIGIRVVKAFVRHEYEDEKFEFSATDVQNAQKQAEKLVILNSPMMMLTMNLSIIAIAWFGGNQIIGGKMMTGELFSFITYNTQILMSLMMITMVFVMIVISQASADRINAVFDEKLDLTDTNGDENLSVADGSVVFENVSFSYAEKAENQVLTDINLRIESGETVGIIGGTGSAKTSLVNLIPRLYDVFQGRILVGGHDVRDYKLDTLRNSVAMVLQKNVLFSGTIRDNLKWGDENATDEEIIEACKAAQAHDFIMSFPNGYDTDLGQGGVNVSGGQKQRLCIARALLKKPKVMILDDSTSAVDTATDNRIRKAFRENHSNITTIFIAQRVTSVMEADKIIVMNDGRIDAVGTHAELLTANNIYREVYESQQKGVN
ncbi:MAG: ABC transporter ATP-binding protein [Flexilinea sp.]